MVECVISMTPNRTILDLDHDQARRLLMQQESYCTVNLPEYIDFSDILDQAADSVHSHATCVGGSKDSNKGGNRGSVAYQYSNDAQGLKDLLEGINYRILQNKDGLLSWRPMELINPIMYVLLVYKLTEEENWDVILSLIHI